MRRQREYARVRGRAGSSSQVNDKGLKLKGCNYLEGAVHVFVSGFDCTAVRSTAFETTGEASTLHRRLFIRSLLRHLKMNRASLWCDGFVLLSCWPLNS